MTTTKTRLSEEFKEYEKFFNKYNLSGSTLNMLDDQCQIIMTENRYELGNRKNFPKKLMETKTKVITARNYAAHITSIGFFHDRVEKEYTYVGYIPTRLICKNPDDTLKIERIFYIKRKNND